MFWFPIFRTGSYQQNAEPQEGPKLPREVIRNIQALENLIKKLANRHDAKRIELEEKGIAVQDKIYGLQELAQKYIQAHTNEGGLSRWLHSHVYDRTQGQVQSELKGYEKAARKGGKSYLHELVSNLVVIILLVLSVFLMFPQPSITGFTILSLPVNINFSLILGIVLFIASLAIINAKLKNSK